MTSLLFVCMGNICRSPMAEGIFRARVAAAGLDGRITTDSAGTIGFHTGNPADSRAQALMEEKGEPINDLRSRKVTPSDFERFDYILAMDLDNYHDLIALCPSHLQNRVHMMLSFADNTSTQEVPDPYYGGDEGFKLVYELLDDAATGLLRDVQSRLNQGR